MQDGSQDSFRAWDASYGQPDLKHSPPEYYTSLITGLSRIHNIQDLARTEVLGMTVN